MTIKQTPDSAWGDLQPMRVVHMQGDLVQGNVRRFLDQRQDCLGMGFDPVRPLVPALRLGTDRPRPPPLIHPFDRRRGRDPEAPRRRLGATMTFNMGAAV